MTYQIERIDCHSHSAYSGHGVGTVEEMVNKADELGLSTYAQTEHLILPDGLDPQNRFSMSDETTKAYMEDLLEMRSQLKKRGSKMQLIIGAEADWLPNRTQELEALCKTYEYVLGSVHFVDNIPVDMKDSSLWEEYGVDGVWQKYFEYWLDMALHPGPITAFSHPDLPKKFGWLPSFDVRPYFYEMAQMASKHDRMIEVNTAGLRKDVGELYPSLELLQSFYDAGVDCTIGCDAHSPAEVGANIDEAIALMQKAGYKRITAPTPDGDRRYIPIV